MKEEEREELVEVIESARDKIRETMQALLQAEGGLSMSAFLTRQGTDKIYAGARGYVMNAQRACIDLCLATDRWLYQGDAELAKTEKAEQEVEK